MDARHDTSRAGSRLETVIAIVVRRMPATRRTTVPARHHDHCGVQFHGSANVGRVSTPEEAETVRLEPGQPAPDFALPDADGLPVRLADFRGRKVVVYFYPKAATPGCTAQACGFRDNVSDFAAAGFDVVGISPDPPAALRRFRDAKHLTFPLLSDPDRAVMRAYGAYGEKRSFGRTVTGVIRSTVVVDETGRVAVAQYAVKATGHVDRLRAELLG